MARPRKFDEAKVLQAVRDEFRVRGYTATSLEDLMKATGLGKGSLYGAFGDKRQLFLRVLGTYADERVVEADETMSCDGPAIECLRAACDPGPLSGSVSGVDRGCLLANSCTELAGLDDDVTACGRQTYQAVEDTFTDAVERAVREGDLPAETKPRDLGRLLLAIQQGAGFLAKTGMDPEAVRQISRTAATSLLG